MKTYLLAVALCGWAAVPAQATTFTYTGAKFDQVSCSARCHFKHFKITIETAETFGRNGEAQFFPGGGNATIVSASYSDGQNSASLADGLSFSGVVLIQGGKVTSADMEVRVSNSSLALEGFFGTDGTPDQLSGSAGSLGFNVENTVPGSGHWKKQ